MNTQMVRAMTLQVRLAGARLGAGVITAVALCVFGAVAWVWGISYLSSQSLAQELAGKRAMNALQSAESPAAVQRPVAEERLTGFYNALGEKRFAEQQVKSLFAIAQKAGLSLNQAEYKSSFDKSGNFHTYQILLPVKGSYRSIRQFCEQTLLTIPFASLDELGFKRDGIGNQTLEVKLRLTLFLNDPAPPAGERDEVPVEDAKT